jgi:Helicase associated domain
MMHELKLYLKEKVCRVKAAVCLLASLFVSYNPTRLELQTKNGEEWDGNVPTNYSIKGKSDDVDEDKNLGRWISRQRSMYQAGKLRKDRQKQLEDIGLRWSVLSTTSWDAMYDTLCQYVKERKAAADPNRAWDGNVPANHKTNDNPPKALGRWINRQRSAYGKGQLKKELVDKLNAIGLRWSVHERRAVVSSSSPDNDDD